MASLQTHSQCPALEVRREIPNAAYLLRFRPACGTLADWVARKWEQLSPDDRKEAVTFGVAVLWLFADREQERSN